MTWDRKKTKLKDTEIGLIPEDWQIKELKDILVDKGYIRGPFGSALRRPELKSEGIPVYEQQNAIYNNRFFRYFIDENRYKDLSRFTVKENDLIISCSGTLGKVSIIHSKDPTGIISQALLILRPNTEKVIPNFLKYFFNSKRGYNSIVSRSFGAVQVNIAKRDIIEKIKLGLPNLKEQKRIVNILSAYDDLTENNSRRIKILEEMAQAIYQEWFVKFRFPGHEKVRMVDSPLGKIPEGWEVGTAGDVVDYHIGGGWGKDEQIGKYIVSAYVIRGTDIPDVRYNQTDSCPLRHHTESNFRSRELLEGDIIFEVSGGSKDQPLGRALLMNKNAFRSFRFPVICASFCKLIRIDKDKLAPELLYLKFLDMYNDRSICKYQVQSTGISNFKFSYFLSEEKLVIPDSGAQIEFKDIVAPMFDMICVLGEKNAKLKKTRDLLLPKLISGEIDVEDLDIDIGELAE